MGRKRYVDSGQPDVDLEREDVRLPSGRRLTAEVVDELVESARRAKGRPSLTGEPEVSPRIAFRVSRQVKEGLEAIAATEGKSFSEVSRDALESYLREHRRSA